MNNTVRVALKRAFSLVELMISLITISVIVAAMTPVITKKLSSQRIAVGSFGGDGNNCKAICPEGFSMGDNGMCINDTSGYEINPTSNCLDISTECSRNHEKCVQCNSLQTYCYICEDGWHPANGICEIDYVPPAEIICPTECNSSCEVDNVCKSCLPGYYLSGTICKNCPAGNYCPGGTSSYQPCPAGQYQQYEGQYTSCTDCAAGTYAEGGAITCSPCPAGKYSGAKAGSCTTCDYGTYSNAGAASCSSCPAGYACKNGTKTQCSAGTSAAAGSSECSSCPSGKYSSSAGASSCADCASGYYSATGATACTACTASFGAGCTKCDSTNGCTQCSSGFFDAGMTCASCPSGCTACTNAETCTACDTDNGYTLINNKCKKWQTPESQTDCDLINGEGLFWWDPNNKVCVFKKNFGDQAGSDNISVVAWYREAEWPNGAWMEDKKAYCKISAPWSYEEGDYSTSDPPCGGVTEYNGCTRTICNIYAATKGCPKVTIGPNAPSTPGEWRAANKTEVRSWDSLEHWKGADLCGHWGGTGTFAKCSGDEQESEYDDGYWFLNWYPEEVTYWCESGRDCWCGQFDDGGWSCYEEWDEYYYVWFTSQRCVTSKVLK